MDDKNFPGALPDTRPEEAKAKDWRKDIASLAQVQWFTKDFEDVKTFPVRDQDGSSSCVAQTLALMLGIENYLEEGRFIEFSAKDIYTRRTNQGGGMIGVEALQIAKDKGATLEVMIPSQKMGESEMNKIVREVSDEQIGNIFRVDNYYQLPFSLEQIAAIIDSNRKESFCKPVMVWFQFPRKEWTAIPKVSTSSNDIVCHSVTAVDFGIVNGEKGIFIQDSWGLHSSTMNGLRFISESYLNSRMVFCAYVNDRSNDWQNKPPAERPVLKRGAKGSFVSELQKLLGIKIDGEFGSRTFDAVKNFQSKHGLVSDGVVGRLTWEKLLGN